MACSLESCSGAVGPKTGWVDVRAFHVTEEQRTWLKVDWSVEGEARLHRECWNNLLLASQNKSDDLHVTELEIALIKEATKTAEVHDPDLFIEQEARRIVIMLQECEYPVFFTGAGISTAAGIGDFRGINGKWTERDKLKAHGRNSQKRCYRNPSMGQLRPTYTHEAIVKLLEMGIFKFVISQNTDGLHRLSGVPESKISELHGNAYVEKCEQCETRYEITPRHRERNTPQLWTLPSKRCGRCHINHRTGRLCEKSGCGGYLMNTIINFGDLLETPVLRSAQKNASRADLFVSLGSTLAVSPANSLVTMGRAPNRLVICNRQATEYDRKCLQADERGVPTGSRVHGDCDKLMAAIMREILGDVELRRWEEGREARMIEYDIKRQ